MGIAICRFLPLWRGKPNTSCNRREWAGRRASWLQGTPVQERSADQTEQGSLPSLQKLIPDCFVVLIPVLAVYCYSLIRLQSLADGDTGWHIAAGRWMLAQHDVPATGILSYTAAQTPWTAHEWLADVLMSLGYGLGGWSGILLLYAFVIAGLVLVLALYLRRWLEPKIAALLLAGALVGQFPFLLARPHVIAGPLQALWTVALLRAREEDRAPPLWMALAMMFWANLHGSFIFGLLLIGPFAAEALFAADAGDRMKVVKQWGLFGLVSVLASVISPYGLQALLFPFQLTSMQVLGAINEWLPSDFSSIGVFEVVLLGGLAGCLWAGVRVPIWRLMVVIGLLHMALAHQRHQALFLIVSSLIVAMPLARVLGREGPRFDFGPAMRALRQDLTPFLAVLAAFALGMTVWRIAVPASRPDSLNVPEAALAHVPVPLRQARVFNEYGFGGSLTMHGIPVYIDGRADMYGEAAMRTYLDLVETPDPARWQAEQRRRGFAWTILPPGKPLVRMLDHQPGWQRLYSDEWAVIHINDDASRMLQTQH